MTRPIESQNLESSLRDHHERIRNLEFQAAGGGLPAGCACVPTDGSGIIQYGTDWEDYLLSLAGLSLWYRFIDADVDPSVVTGGSQSNVILERSGNGWPTDGVGLDLTAGISGGSGSAASVAPIKGADADKPPFGPVDRLGWETQFIQTSTTTGDKPGWQFDGSPAASGTAAYYPLLTAANVTAAAPYSGGSEDRFTVFCFAKPFSGSSVDLTLNGGYGEGLAGAFGVNGGSFMGGWGMFADRYHQVGRVVWGDQTGVGLFTANFGWLQPDTWVALAFTWDKVNLLAYKNGQLMDTTPCTVDPTNYLGALFVNNLESDFGVSQRDNFYYGAIAELAIFHEVLDQDEIATLSSMLGTNATGDIVGGSLSGITIVDGTITRDKLASVLLNKQAVNRGGTDMTLGYPSLPDAAVHSIFWSYIVPEDYEDGDLTFRAYHKNTVGSGLVRLNLTINRYRDATAVSVVQSATIVSRSVTDTNTAVVEYVVDKAAFQIGDTLEFQMVRDGTHGTDSNTGVENIHALGVEYNGKP